ncbi:hypothetical protein OCAR_7503 [Afipia carboxidovorans OM5]|nr:hypothetical protein OCAR_7503 [Afipia carboxidovorans OM5]
MQFSRHADAASVLMVTALFDFLETTHSPRMNWCAAAA